MVLYIPNQVDLPNQNSFINGVESLHIVGTYERGDVEEEGEVYEVVNIKTLKQVSKELFSLKVFISSSAFFAKLCTSTYITITCAKILCLFAILTY